MPYLHMFTFRINRGVEVLHQTFLESKNEIITYAEYVKFMKGLEKKGTITEKNFIIMNHLVIKK